MSSSSPGKFGLFVALQMPEIPEATIQLHCESKYIIKRVQIFCKMV